MSTSILNHESETIHFLTQEEPKKLLKVIDNKRDKALFYSAYRYGLRGSEIGLLHRDDVDFKRMKIRNHRLLKPVLNCIVGGGLT